MIRQPAFESVANMLAKTFADAGVDFGHQRTLNLTAQLQGYKNYAHYKAEADRKERLAKLSGPAAPTTPEPYPGPTQVEMLRDGLEWLMARTQEVLAGTPVRDMDECLLHAKLLVRNASK
jgi:hypothetical protein